MINRTVFFSYVRAAPFGGRLEQSQVDGLNAILDEWERRQLRNLDWLAYMLATVRHETDAKMQPVEESLYYTTAARIKAVWPSRFPTVASAQPFVKNPKALANKVYNGRMGNRTGSNDGWDYRGRGLPQITGHDMYEKFGIVGNPDAALQLAKSVQILFDGMIGGLYTGKKLSDYFTDTSSDPVKARAIVNGTDSASLIANYFRNFRDAIDAAVKAAVTGDIPAKVDPKDAKPDDVTPAKSGSFWTILIGFFGGGTGAVTAGSQLIGSVNNGWAFLALISLVLILLGGGALAYLIWSGRLKLLQPHAAALTVDASPEKPA